MNSTGYASQSGPGWNNNNSADVLVAVIAKRKSVEENTLENKIESIMSQSLPHLSGLWGFNYTARDKTTLQNDETTETAVSAATVAAKVIVATPSPLTLTKRTQSVRTDNKNTDTVELRMHSEFSRKCVSVRKEKIQV